jgi:hypothetical protein
VTTPAARAQRMMAQAHAQGWRWRWGRRWLLLPAPSPAAVVVWVVGRVGDTALRRQADQRWWRRRAAGVVPLGQLFAPHGLRQQIAD